MYVKDISIVCVCIYINGWVYYYSSSLSPSDVMLLEEEEATDLDEVDGLGR